MSKKRPDNRGCGKCGFMETPSTVLNLALGYGVPDVPWLLAYALVIGNPDE